MKLKAIEIHSCAKEFSIMSFPMGGLCIKSAINSSHSLPKAILFEHILSDDAITCARETVSRHSSAIGLSLYIWNYKWMKSFAYEIKRLSPSTIIFAGGPQCIDFTKALPKWLDFAILGEGEISTVQVLESINTGKKLENLQIDGLITSSFISPVNSSLPDLSKLPSPFLSGEASSIIENYDSVLWELTRGCPFACAFCFESRGKKIVRDYPLDRIEAELNYLIEHEIVNVFVLDPTFNLNLDRAKTIMRLLIEKAPCNMHFTFEVRVELIDEELADLFSKLNCSLQIGLQSSDDEVLKTIGRRFDKNLFEQKTRLLAKRGISYGLDIIIGLPKDNPKRFRNTVNFAVSLMPSNIDCFLLSLLPGTELNLREKEFGYIANKDDQRTIIKSPTFSEHDIENALIIRRGMDLFYTKGQSCMWIHCILEALNISACNLFSLFVKWLDQTNRSEDEDIWILQDEFVESLFEKTKNNKLIPAIKSFMELHQGLCYVTDTTESVQLELSYTPEDLSKLDKMSLQEFVKTHRIHHCNPTIIWEDDNVKIY